MGKKRCFSWTSKERQQLVFNVTGSQGAPVAVKPPTLDLSHEVPGPRLAAEWALLAEIQPLPACICCLLKFGSAENHKLPLKTLIPQSLLDMNCSNVFHIRDLHVFELFPPKGSSWEIKHPFRDPPCPSPTHLLSPLGRERKAPWAAEKGPRPRVLLPVLGCVMGSGSVYFPLGGSTSWCMEGINCFHLIT